MMRELEQAVDNLFTYAVSTMTGVPVALRAKLRDTLRPRYNIYQTAKLAAELIYRHRDVLPVAALNIGVALAEAADQAAAMNMHVDRRGWRIGTAIRKMAGVDPRPAPTTDDPAPVDDPFAPEASTTILPPAPAYTPPTP